MAVAVQLNHKFNVLLLQRRLAILLNNISGQTNSLYRTCVVNIVDGVDDGLSNGEVAASVSVPLIVIIILVIVVAVMVVKKRIAFSITSGNQASNNGAHQDQPIR